VPAWCAWCQLGQQLHQELARFLVAQLGLIVERRDNNHAVEPSAPAAVRISFMLSIAVRRTSSCSEMSTPLNPAQTALVLIFRPCSAFWSSSTRFARPPRPARSPRTRSPPGSRVSRPASCPAPRLPGTRGAAAPAAGGSGRVKALAEGADRAHDPGYSRYGEDSRRLKFHDLSKGCELRSGSTRACISSSGRKLKAIVLGKYCRGTGGEKAASSAGQGALARGGTPHRGVRPAAERTSKPTSASWSWSPCGLWSPAPRSAPASPRAARPTADD